MVWRGSDKGREMGRKETKKMGMGDKLCMVLKGEERGNIGWGREREWDVWYGMEKWKRHERLGKGRERNVSGCCNR